MSKRRDFYLVEWRNRAISDYVSRIDRPRVRRTIFPRNMRQLRQITGGSHDRGVFNRHRDISKSRISHEIARDLAMEPLAYFFSSCNTFRHFSSDISSNKMEIFCRLRQMLLERKEERERERESEWDSLFICSSREEVILRVKWQWCELFTNTPGINCSRTENRV